jgi:hypothetical protein
LDIVDEVFLQEIPKYTLGVLDIFILMFFKDERRKSYIRLTKERQVVVTQVFLRLTVITMRLLPYTAPLARTVG